MCNYRTIPLWHLYKSPFPSLTDSLTLLSECHRDQKKTEPVSTVLYTSSIPARPSLLTHTPFSPHLRHPSGHTPQVTPLAPPVICNQVHPFHPPSFLIQLHPCQPPNIWNLATPLLPPFICNPTKVVQSRGQRSLPPPHPNVGFSGKDLTKKKFFHLLTLAPPPRHSLYAPRNPATPLFIWNLATPLPHFIPSA